MRALLRRLSITLVGRPVTVAYRDQDSRVTLARRRPRLPIGVAILINGVLLLALWVALYVLASWAMLDLAARP